MMTVVESALAPNQTSDDRVRLVECKGKRKRLLGCQLHVWTMASDERCKIRRAIGIVDIRWDVLCGLDGAEALQFRWVEAGGLRWRTNNPNYLHLEGGKAESGTARV